MLSRKNRFHGHKSVSRVRGKRIVGTGFVVYSSHTKRHDFRMAVVVSRKVSKSAVTRNRIRRRLYEIVRVSKILEGQPVDAVFVVNDEKLKDMQHQELQQSVEKCCQKALNSR